MRRKGRQYVGGLEQRCEIIHMKRKLGWRKLAEKLSDWMSEFTVICVGGAEDKNS